MEEPLMRMLNLLETTSPMVFGWLVEQVIIKGWIMFAFSVVLCIISVISIIWIAWRWKITKDYDTSPYAIGTILGGLLFLLSIGLFADGMYHIYTPEAHALRNLLPS